MPHLFSFFKFYLEVCIGIIFEVPYSIFVSFLFFQYQYFFTHFFFFLEAIVMSCMHSNPISSVQKLSPEADIILIATWFQFYLLFSVGLKASSNFLATFSFDSRVYVCLHEHRSMINRFRDRSSNSAQPGSSFFSASTPPLNRSAGNGNFQKSKINANVLAKIAASSSFFPSFRHHQ